MTLENFETSYQILWQDEAQEDLKEIATYYREAGGLELTEKNLDRILNSIDGLKKMPERCQISSFSPNIRRLTVVNLPYLVFFKIIGDKVYILRIFSAKRSPKTIQNQLKNF